MIIEGRRFCFFFANKLLGMVAQAKEKEKKNEFILYQRRKRIKIEVDICTFLNGSKCAPRERFLSFSH